MSFLQAKAIPLRKRIDQQGYLRDILAAGSREGEIVRNLYEKTVRTWSSPRPVFRVKVQLQKPPGPQGGRETRPLTIEVTTTSDIYRYVDEGTRRRWIAPRIASVLLWRTGGAPKTTPRVVGSTRGRRATGPFAASKGHWHPGITAREFTKEIKKRRAKQFFKNMDKAIRAAQRRHAW